MCLVDDEASRRSRLVKLMVRAWDPRRLAASIRSHVSAGSGDTIKVGPRPPSRRIGVAMDGALFLSLALNDVEPACSQVHQLLPRCPSWNVASPLAGARFRRSGPVHRSVTMCAPDRCRSAVGRCRLDRRSCDHASCPSSRPECRQRPASRSRVPPWVCSYRSVSWQPPR